MIYVREKEEVRRSGREEEERLKKKMIYKIYNPV